MMTNMHLLSLLTLSSLIVTGLAQDTENEKICVVNEDPSICTVTVVRRKDHVMPGVPDTVDESWAYVLDNECNSILDSSDCNSDGEIGTICKQNIGEEDTSAELSALDKGSSFYLEDAGDGEGLTATTPIFTLTYGDGEPISDEEGNDDSCTCAQSVHPVVDDQVCSCWITCSD